jgi:hypothetical protein
MYHVIQKYLNFEHNYIDNVHPQGNGIFNLSLVKITTDKINLVDLSQNYTSPSDVLALDVAFKKLNISYIILSPNTCQPSDTILYFPMFYLYGIISWNKFNIAYPKNVSFSCLNRNPHVHRIYNYIKLLNKNYQNSSIMSFYNTEGSDFNNCYSQLDTEILENWYKIKSTLETQCSNDLEIDHPAYKSAYINIVTETTVFDEVFLSEKIWKPIASGQLFLVVGSRNTIQYLRELGVDVFDDIIDHSYDVNQNWKSRIDKMQESLDKLLSQDLELIFKITEDRRMNNVNNFFAGKFGIHYINKINSLLT